MSNVATFNDGATTTSYAYDANNRLLVSSDALGNQTTYSYVQAACSCSEANEVTSIHTPDLAPGQAWSMTYGSEGRLTTVTDPYGAAEQYAYAPTGQLTSIVDQNGNPTTMSYDQLGRRASLLDPLSRAHADAYTVPASAAWSGPTLMSGSASSTTPSTDFTAALSAGNYQIGHNLYELYGYPPSVSFYRDATFELSYYDQWDEAQRQTNHVDRAGLPSSSTQQPSSGAYTQLSTGYDPSTAMPEVDAYDSPAAGHEDETSFDLSPFFDVNDTSGFGTSGSSVRYTYSRDVGGRLLGVSSLYSYSTAFFDGPPQTYSYYPNGTPQQYSGPDGSKTFTYDARGLLQSIAVTLQDGGTETWTFAYDAMERNSQLTYPDGHVRVQQYDSEGRITSRCYAYGSQAYCYTASYDGVGNPLTMTDPYGGSDSLAYDSLNRLTQVTHSISGSVEHVENYAYNAIGALHTSFDPVAMAPVTFDDQRPLVSGAGNGPAAVPATTPDGQTITLDAGGRITSLEGATFTYDWRNRIIGTQFSSGTDTIGETYGYDSYMNRVSRVHTETSPASTTSTFYGYDSAMDLVAQIDASNDVLDAWIFDGTDHPLRLRSGGASTYYELDLAGNVRRLRDASGNDLGGYRYTAFGAAFPPDAETPAPSVSQPLQWKARWFEGSIAGGVYDVRARWWSPTTGTFLGIDDYKYHDPRSAPVDPATTLWSWPGECPVRFRDPTGDDPETTCEAVGFAATLWCIYLGGPQDRCIQFGLAVYNACMRNPPNEPPNFNGCNPITQCCTQPTQTPSFGPQPTPYTGPSIGPSP